MKKFRVMITGGGTGGHIYPIIAVVEELQLQTANTGIDLRLKYLGSYGPYKELLKANNLKVSVIIQSKIRRYFSLLNILEIPKLILGFLQALWGAYWFMPDVLFSKGGPGALPVVLAAWFYGIPIVIHESDAAPGLTNLISGRYAKKAATSFPAVEQYFGKKTVLVGNPIRGSILKNIKFDKAQTKRRLGFDAGKPLMLVMGGSQGSVRINDFIIKNLALILQVTQVLHQTGKENYDGALNQAAATLKDAPEEMKNDYKIVPYFSDNITDAYVASDIVVARAGAGLIFEIAAFKKPSILIPLPESAQDHQRLNAYDYQSAGASVVVEETNLFPNIFLDKLIEILGDRGKYESMCETAGKFYKPDAASNLAKIILDFKA